MITVHHLENSRSHRVIWLLEELGEEYEVKRYARDPKTQLAPAELKAVHPLGKSPVITDGDETIAETGAIIEYLLETYGNESLLLDEDARLVPPLGTPAYRRYRYWMHAAEGSMMPLVVMKLVFKATTQKPVPLPIRPLTKAVAAEVGKSYIDPSLDAMLDYIETQLSKSQWFAGDHFTAADIMMSFPCESADALAGVSGKYALIDDFLKRVQARPAYQAAIEKGGEYDLKPQMG